MDMHEGIITRFRTMGIARASVLVGHVVGSTIQTIVGLAVVIGVAMLVGFRPNASLIEWVAVAGVLLMITIAITWLSVALGLLPDSVEAASNLPMPLILLPFLSSGFVPTESMPAGIRWFALASPSRPARRSVAPVGDGDPRSATPAVAWRVHWPLGKWYDGALRRVSRSAFDPGREAAADRRVYTLPAPGDRPEVEEHES
jgi:ABC-2 type transport system permease protein